jgi:hypothetical protein
VLVGTAEHRGVNQIALLRHICLSRPPGLFDPEQIESALRPQTSDMTQSGLLVDETSKRGVDGCPDGVGAGCGSGSGEKLVIDLDKSLGHGSSISHTANHI